MKRNFNLFKIVKNLFGTKKIAEAVTPVVETETEVKKRASMGGLSHTESRFTASLYAKKKRNRMQGQSRNINHRKAA